jgi:hypothetical protein
MRRIATLVAIAAAAAVGIPTLVYGSYRFDRVEQSHAQSTQILGLHVAQAQRTSIEGRDGINITFDKSSAERVRQFTRDVVGRRVVVFVNQRRLATLHLLDPITGEGLLLTGDALDGVATQALFSCDSVVDLAVE